MPQPTLQQIADKLYDAMWSATFACGKDIDEKLFKRILDTDRAYCDATQGSHKQQQLIEEIQNERRYQQVAEIPSYLDDRYSVADWEGLIQQELSEAVKAAMLYQRPLIRDHLIKAAAFTLAALEYFDWGDDDEESEQPTVPALPVSSMNMTTEDR